MASSLLDGSPRNNIHLATSAQHANPTTIRHTTRPDRVVDITRQCIALFGRTRADRALDLRAKTGIENQLGRFKIWAGAIGVFAAGTASTDARLRNDEDVKEIMMDMLIRLRKALDGFLRPSIAEESEDEEASGESDDSEASLILSIGDESDAATSEEHTPSHQVDSLRDIDGVISRLYRLSAIIRKPNSLHENTRVASFIEKAEEGPEAADFEAHARWQIKYRLPDASPKMVDRLVNAVIFRRRKLLYRERHQKKLSQGVEAAFQAEIVLPALLKPSQKRKLPTQPQSSLFLKSGATVRSLSSTIPLSATEASAVNRRALASYPKSLAGGSNLTRSAIARRDQLDVPPPPKPTEAAEAICPYCFEIVDKAKMALSLWTRHVLKDIDPYVCLFEDCSRPNEQYQSFDDWITYMKWQHTLVWSCHTTRHKHLKFNSSADCEDHMQREHMEDISTSQLAFLVEKSAQPASDPLEIITRYEEAGDRNRSVCPFCPFAVVRVGEPEPNTLVPVADLSLDDSKKMRDHIAAHLEAIALLSLPEQEVIDNAASDEVQSESSKIGASSRGEEQDRDPLFSTSDAWLEYNLAQASIESNSIVAETDREPMSNNSDEDWAYVTSALRPELPSLDPGQDPILIVFIERARRLQTLELYKRFGIPLVVVRDPEGLEVPEERWSGNPEQLQTHVSSLDHPHDVDPKLLAEERQQQRGRSRSRSRNRRRAEEQEQMYAHESFGGFFAPEDILQGGREDT